MNDIVRPITADGSVGFDGFNQLVYRRHEGEWIVTSIISDVRGKLCVVCGHGWKETGPGLADQDYWRNFDEHVHQSCAVRFRALQDRGDFYMAVVDAGLRFKMISIPNGYWPDSYPESKAPWYRFELLDYPGITFTIGARKRVFLFEVCGEIPWYSRAASEFASENVTMEFESSRIMLHAWNTNKLRDYVARAARLLTTVPKLEVDRYG